MARLYERHKSQWSLVKKFPWEKTQKHGDHELTMQELNNIYLSVKHD